MARLLYLDSSALVKLVLPEAESEALLQCVVDRPDRVTSQIAMVEVLRAARRASDDPAVEQRARQVLAGVHLLGLDDATLDAAATIEPRRVGALDAIHLATAIDLGPALESMIIYDSALADAARSAGIQVLAPGA